MYYQPLCNNIYKLVNIRKRAPICRSTSWAFITKKNSICSHYRNVNQINGQGAITENPVRSISFLTPQINTDYFSSKYFQANMSDWAGPFFGPYMFCNLSHVRDTVHCQNHWPVFIDLIYCRSSIFRWLLIFAVTWSPRILIPAN